MLPCGGHLARRTKILDIVSASFCRIGTGISAELRGRRAADDIERKDERDKAIIAIEQGWYSPSLEMAFQIARVFDVPLDEVFDYPKEA